MRLELSTGPKISDPNEERVEQALRSIGAQEEFVILVDDDAEDGRFIQAAKDANAFTVEYWDGERQHQSKSLPVQVVIPMFLAYLKQDESWKAKTEWKDITKELASNGGCRATVGVVLMVCVGVAAAYTVLW